MFNSSIYIIPFFLLNFLCHTHTCSVVVWVGIGTGREKQIYPTRDRRRERCCNLIYTTQKSSFPPCGLVFQVMLKWTKTSLCNRNNFSTHIQYTQPLIYYHSRITQTIISFTSFSLSSLTSVVCCATALHNIFVTSNSIHEFTLFLPINRLSRQTDICM